MTKKELVNDVDRILKSLEDGFLRADLDGCVIMANEAIAIMCGYSSPEEMIGLHMKELYANPQERDFMISQIKSKGKLLNYELELKRKDGTIFWTLNNIKPLFDEKGNLQGTEGVIRDITTRKRMEEELRAANQQLSASEEELRAANQQLAASDHQLRAANEHLQAANQQLTANEKELIKSKETAERYLNVAAEIILVLDDKGNISLLNESGHKVLGYENRELIGKNWFETCLPESNVNEVKSIFKQIMKGQIENVANYESDIQTKSGEVRSISWHNTVLIDENGNITGTLSSGEDITERKKAETQLKTLIQQLQVANQQLAANEQQLQASNQQLTANEEELRAANQQLKAANQQLAANEQQLRASEAELKKQLEKSERQRKANLILLKDNTKNTRKLINEINQRKKTEDALKKSEERLNLVMKGSNDAAWDWDLVKDELYYSPQWWAQIGYKTDEIAKDSQLWARLRHPDDIERVDVLFADALKNKDSYEIDFRLKHKDGHYIYVVSRGFITRTKNGKPIRVSGTNVDITELKKAEEALKQSQERFQIAMSASNDGLFDWDLITNEIYYSPGWKRMLGYEDHELPNDFSIWEKTTNPEDVKRSWAMQQKLISKQIDRFVLEFKMKHKKGHWIDVLSRAKAIFDENGKAIRIVGTHVDITERKKAEEEIRMLSQFPIQNPNPVLRIAKNGKIIFQNEASKAILKEWKVKADQLKGDPLDQVRKAIKTATKIRSDLKVEEKYYSLTFSAIPDSDLVNIYGLDITELMQIEQAMKESEEKYRVLSENAKHLIVTHDLNGTILYANKFALNFMNISEDHIIGENIVQFINSKEDMKALKQRQQDFLSGKEMVHHYELNVKSPSGDIRILEAYGNPIIRNNEISSVMVVAYDITARKQAEKALKESEDFLNRTGQIARVGGWYLSDSFDKVYWTQTTGRIHELPDGYFPSLEEAISFYHSDDRALVRQSVEAAIMDGKPFDFETRLITAKGNVVWVQALGNPEMKNGKCVRLSGTFQDITERRKNEEYLRVSELKYKTIVEGSIQGMVIAQADPVRLSFASEPMQDISGYTPKELMEFGPEDLNELIYYEDRERFFSNFQSRLLGKQTKNRAEYRINHKKGDIRWVELFSSLVEYEGKPATQTVFVDITERKKAEEGLKDSEEKFRSYVDAAPNGIFIVDEKGRYVDVNPAASTITGYSRKELLKLSISDLMEENDPETSLKNFRKLKEKGSLQFEKSFITKSGEKRYWEISSVRLSDTRFLGFTKDITERWEAEQEILEHQHHLNVLQKIGTLATSTLDLHELLMLILDGALEAVGTSVGMIFLRDRQSKRLSWGASVGLSKNFVSEYKHNLIEPDEGLSGSIAETGKSIFIEQDSSHDPRITREVVKKEKLNSFIGVPIYAEDEIIGVLNILSRAPVVLDEKDVVLVKAVGAYVGSAINNARLFEKLSQTEKTLSESEKRLQEAEQIGKLGHVDWVVAEQRSYWSKEIFRIYERDPKLGVPGYEEIMNLHTPEDAARLEAAVIEALQNGKDYDLDLEAIMPSGQKKTLHIIGRPVKDKSGTITNIKGTVQDITERKLAEEKYRNLISTTSEGFWMINSKSETIDVNESLCYMLEHEKDDMIGSSIFEFVDEENAAIFQKQVKDAKSTKQRSYEIILRSKSGKQIPTIFNATSQFDESGRRIGSFAFITNIAERKEAEMLIEKSLREKETLLRELYHRTKNNMQVISSMLSLQSRSTENELLKTAYKDINSKIKSMALVHKKLYESHDLSNLNLKEYVSDLIGLIWQSNSIQVSNIEFQYEVEEIMANLDMVVPLGLAINELISNVIKHAFPNDRKGNLSLKLYRDKEKRIHLEIEDDGVGVSKDLDLRQNSSMGLQIFFNLIEYQLRGKVDYKSENGLKWSIVLDDDLYKKRV